MTKIVLIAALGAIASVSAAGPAAVELGTAGCYTILSSLAISNLPDGSGLTSAIKGNMGVSTISSVGEITGFSLTDDSTKTFATSLLVEGRVYDADYAAPTPTLLTVAVGAMGIAYTDAAERPPPYYEEEDDDTDVPADNFGRDSRPVPGLFKYLSSVNITGDFTISGSPTDTWIFLITRDLIMAKNVQITLVDGALASNIFWQVGGLVDVGIGAHMEGILLAKSFVDFRSGSSLNGRILSQGTVNLQSATVQSVSDTTSTTSCTTLESQSWCETLDRSLLDKSSRRFCTKELRQSLSSLWKSHLAHPTAKSDQVHGPIFKYSTGGERLQPSIFAAAAVLLLICLGATTLSAFRRSFLSRAAMTIEVLFKAPEDDSDVAMAVQQLGVGQEESLLPTNE